MSTTGSAHSIRATKFGSEPYFSSSATNNDTHHLDPNQETGKHRSKLIFTYLYTKSQTNLHVACSSLAQQVQKQHEKAGREQAYANLVQGAEDDLERLSQSEHVCPQYTKPHLTR